MPLSLSLEEDLGVVIALVLEEKVDFKEHPRVEEEVFMFDIEPRLQRIPLPLLFLIGAIIEGRSSSMKRRSSRG